MEPNAVLLSIDPLVIRVRGGQEFHCGRLQRLDAAYTDGTWHVGITASPQVASSSGEGQYAPHRGKRVSLDMDPEPMPCGFREDASERPLYPNTDREPHPNFKVGDKVILASGGPCMTVEESSLSELICTWFDEADELCTETFDPRMLRAQA